MRISTKSRKGAPILSVYETIQVVLSGGMFIIALVTLIVKILNNDEKN